LGLGQSYIGLTSKNTKYLTFTAVRFPHAVIVGKMGRAYGAYGGEEECKTGFGWGNLKLRSCMEDLVLDGRIKVKWILKEQDNRAWSRIT